MNTNYPKSSDTQTSLDAVATDPALDALLDQALDAGDVSGDLQQRIIALSDPQMNTLLDEALQPGALPDALEGRINAAVQAANSAASLPVVGRIGFPSRSWHYAAAAVVAIASGLGIYFSPGFSSPQTPGDDPAARIASLEEDFALLAEVLDDDPIASLDFSGDINAVATRIQAVDDSFWGGDAGTFEDDLWQEISLESNDPLLF